MPKKKTKVPVTMRALTQRINRKLKTKEQMLKAAPPAPRNPEHRANQWRARIGDFYVLDTRVNMVLHTRVDPEALGRKLGVLKEWEEVVS
jgi:hypothetical protein